MQTNSIEQARKVLLDYPHVCSMMFLVHLYNSYLGEENFKDEDPFEVEIYKRSFGFLLEATKETGIEFFLVQKSMFEKFAVAIDDSGLEEIARKYPFLEKPGYVYLLISSFMGSAPSDLKVALLKRMARLYEIINGVSISNNKEDAEVH